jgi:hypothetical protein
MLHPRRRWHLVSHPSSLTHRRSVGRSHGPRTRQIALGAAFVGLPYPTPSRSWIASWRSHGWVPASATSVTVLLAGLEVVEDVQQGVGSSGGFDLVDLTWLARSGLESAQGRDVHPLVPIDPESPACFRSAGFSPFWGMNRSPRCNVSRQSRPANGPQRRFSEGGKG